MRDQLYRNGYDPDTCQPRPGVEITPPSDPVARKVWEMGNAQKNRNKANE